MRGLYERFVGTKGTYYSRCACLVFGWSAPIACPTHGTPIARTFTRECTEEFWALVEKEAA